MIELPHNWNPRDYQVPTWAFHERGGLRSVNVWHRRAGKDLLGINLCATKMIERVGVYWHLLPTYKQGRNIVWNGFTKEGIGFLDHFPEGLLAAKPNTTEMRVQYKNGSIYQVVGTDNIDSLVGTNPIGCVFSEYSLQDPRAWDLIRPILAENGGWATFIYTARGHNHGYDLFQMASTNPEWHCELRIAGDHGTKRPDGTPVISDKQIQDERDAQMPEELIQQEFYCNFDAPLVGAYYSAQMKAALEQGRICDVPWEPRLPVNTYWDLGLNDCTSIWFVQTHGYQHRIIDYVEDAGEGLPYYARILRGQEPGFERMGEYLYGRHVAPWDISVKELGSGKSRIETAKECGIRFTPHLFQLAVHDRIDAVRNILPMCWFDKKRCYRGIEGLKTYRKEWNEKLRTWNDKPTHDWSSHPADAFGLFGITSKDASHDGRRKRMLGKTIDNTQYV